MDPVSQVNHRLGWLVGWLVGCLLAWFLAWLLGVVVDVLVVVVVVGFKHGRMPVEANSGTYRQPDSVRMSICLSVCLSVCASLLPPRASRDTAERFLLVVASLRQTLWVSACVTHSSKTEHASLMSMMTMASHGRPDSLPSHCVRGERDFRTSTS